MKHASLFSGIGGFDLAAEWMGWENILHCEINPFCQRVLKYYWPKSTLYENIKTTDFTPHKGKIDILTGGFPCQPYSMAGRRLGKDDERHLWPEMLRAIREISPRWIVGENVRGITNWNRGLVFDEVQSDLEAEGYEVLPFLLPACAVDAPHRRDRVWIVAHANCGECKEWRDINGEWKHKKKNKTRVDDRIARLSELKTIADTNNKGLQRGKRGNPLGGRDGEEAFRPVAERFEVSLWANWPTQPPVCSRNDGISSKLDGLTFSKWRIESLKGYGNAIVPQVAIQIFKAINELEKTFAR